MSIRLVTHNRTGGRLIITEGGQTRERSTAGLVPSGGIGIVDSSIHAIGPGVYFISSYIPGATTWPRYGISTEKVDYRFPLVDYGRIMDQHPDDPTIFLFRRYVRTGPGARDWKWIYAVGQVSYGPAGGDIRILFTREATGNVFWFAPGPVGPQNVTNSGGNLLGDPSVSGQGFCYDYAGRVHHFQYGYKTVKRMGPHLGHHQSPRATDNISLVDYHGVIDQDEQFNDYFAPFVKRPDEVEDRIMLPDGSGTVHTVEDLTRWALPTMRAGLIGACGRNLAQYLLESY